ncbi:MAG: hypothetical protein GC181_13810 [Bacteroidetes bacterium]|nr:hypothetical protein [Bacteroidota bacterium]
MSIQKLLNTFVAMYDTNRTKNPELAKRITPHHKRLVSKVTGYGETYINSVLNVENKRFNPKIVAMCEAILAGEDELIKILKQLNEAVES